MNLDKLKSDIANNEICVLVNGQPETVDFKQWCKDVAINFGFYEKEIKTLIVLFSDGKEPFTFAQRDIYNLLDY